MPLLPLYRFEFILILIRNLLQIEALDLQVLGIILGFMYEQIVQRKKTQRDVQIWNSGEEYSALARSSPIYGDYSKIDNRGEVKLKCLL